MADTNLNLVQYNPDLTPEQRKAASAKGGKHPGKSARRNVASKIRYLRRRGFSQARISNIKAALENPEFSLLEQRAYIDEILDLAASDHDMRLYNVGIKLLMEWHKLAHPQSNDDDIKASAKQPAIINVYRPEEQQIIDIKSDDTD